MIQNARQQGIQAIYKKVRPSLPSIPIDIPKFLNHGRSLFSSDSPPVFIPIPTCEVENHPLSSHFSVDEVSSGMNQAKSKACSLSGLSPFLLKSMKDSLAPLLCRVFNQCLIRSYFPSSWLESIVFFIHKKGSTSDPNNFRSISIQNPFLKLFSSLLCQRLLKFSCSQNILPTFQFGFRPNRSTVGAATLLYEVVKHRFSEHKNTYACFVDFSKAFDSVDRTLLLVKLQTLGIPSSFCRMYATLLNNSKSVIRSGSTLSAPFSSDKGVPQGDPSSPLLFNLFVSDLPDSLAHTPPSLNNTEIPYIQYADDLVLLADSPDDLQIAIDSLNLYCQENHLKINSEKTKCLIFHKGRLPKLSFLLQNSELEIVSEFKYLGFTFTPQLSFSKHISTITKKAHSRIGSLFFALPLKHLPLSLALKVFGCYILPLYRYGLPLWLENCSKASIDSVDATFTMFLKRYLGVPKFANNTITHFLCGTTPLSHYLKSISFSTLGSISLPPSLSGYKLQLVDSLSPPTVDFSPIPNIPSFFWHSRSFFDFPLNPSFRKSLCFDLFDLNHYAFCKNKSFHIPRYYRSHHGSRPHLSQNCFCLFCNQSLEAYHIYDCPSFFINPSLPPKFFPLKFGNC